MMRPVIPDEINISADVFETIIGALIYVGSKGYLMRGKETEIKYYLLDESMTLLLVIPTISDKEGPGSHIIEIPEKHWKFKEPGKNEIN